MKLDSRDDQDGVLRVLACLCTPPCHIINLMIIIFITNATKYLLCITHLSLIVLIKVDNNTLLAYYYE